MADNSVMHNIGMVEQFGKNISHVNMQQLEIFKKLQKQLQTIGNIWQDDMYQQFAADFNQDIMKKIQEISVKLEIFAKYVEKQCELQRMTQQNRY